LEHWRRNSAYEKISIGLVPGPVSIPRKIRESWLTDFGSSDLQPEFFGLYAENQFLLKKILGTKESVVIISEEAMSILCGGGLNSARRSRKSHIFYYKSKRIAF
jgi:hypothetical protein